MLARLFLCFVLTLIAELFLLLWFADRFGWRMALGEVLFSGILGVMVTRWQNVQIFRRVQSQLAAGEAPTSTVLHGVLILLAGILLIVPGMITDVVGLLLLVPLFRKLLGLSVALWIHRRFRLSTFASGNPTDPAEVSQVSHQPTARIIDVEVLDHPTEDSPREDS